MPRKDPYEKFQFCVEMDGITQCGFSKCTFLDTPMDPAEYRERKEAPGFRKPSDPTKYSNITLKQGITDSANLCKWRQQIIGTGGGRSQEEQIDHPH
jgi:phage tail-like protein